MTGPEQDTATPFLSVVVPVGTAGTQALRETLLSLVGQDDDDFEVVLAVGAGAEPDVVAGATEAVADQPPRLRSRTRLVEADGQSPGAVRRSASAAARGRYVSVLPEGDLALGRWVRTYREGEPRADGRILRALGVAQEHTWVDVGGHRAVRAVSTPGAASPAEFSLWEHALEPCSPAASWAWPRTLVDDHDTTYDLAVADDPDWELFVRAAQLVGVLDLGVVTCLARVWQPAETAVADVPGGSTAQDTIDSRALLIQPGEARRHRDRLVETAQSAVADDELARTTEELRLTHDHAANLEAVVRSLEGQLAAAADGHEREISRLRRKLERSRGPAPEAVPPATPPPGATGRRSWRGRRGDDGSAT